MNLRTIPAFELYNMDKPDPFNESMVFRSYKGAELAQFHYGGEIRPLRIHTKAE